MLTVKDAVIDDEDSQLEGEDEDVAEHEVENDESEDEEVSEPLRTTFIVVTHYKITASMRSIERLNVSQLLLSKRRTTFAHSGKAECDEDSAIMKGYVFNDVILVNHHSG
jgi:hypothetical protein